MSKPKPIPEYFVDLFSCDPATGTIIRKVPRKTARAGDALKVRVRVSEEGYVHTSVRVDHQDWLTHRVVWFLCKGEQPPDLIDHRNGDATDNSLDNLREATFSKNGANRRQTKGRALPKGVWGTPYGTYLAHITVNRRRIGLGTYATPELAQQAYLEAAQKFFGEFARAA